MPTRAALDLKIFMQASKETVGCEFERADLKDFETLVELMREFYDFEHLSFDEERSPAALRQILTDETNGRVWLIKEGEKVAGYLVLALGFSLEFHGRDAFLDELFFREEFRGKGYGKAALNFLEEQCFKIGVNALHLEVERKNERARRVYLKNGFVEHDRFLMTKWIFNDKEK